MMVSFRMHIDPSHKIHIGPLQPDMVVIDILVIPGLGLFSFLLAVILSLISTDIVLYYEEQIKIFKTDLRVLPRQSISGTEIEMRTDEGIVVYSFTILGKCCIAFLLFVTICLL